jgi:Fic family protein
MQDKLKLLAEKKKELDSFRPLPPEQLKSLEDWLDNEYTYTSNAIEGNTLNRSETALVVEKGITVRGKSLNEHLEAVNHDKAIHFMRSIIKKGHQFITEQDIKDIHKIILSGINNNWAGNYRLSEVLITGADIAPPPPQHVPFKMRDLIGWLELQQEGNPVEIATKLHFKFVEIHPFADGNGRTARLLMNLVLMQNGYPIAIIKTDERDAYIDAINEGTVTGDLTNFGKVIATAVERSLDAYLSAIHGKSILPFYVDKNDSKKKKLLKIGDLAELAEVPIPTIRYYIRQRLIRPTTKTQGGFMLFVPQIADRIRTIKKLQKEDRLTIKDIRRELTKIKKN